MRQMVFAGFICGFLGLGLSLAFSLRSLGQVRFSKRVLVWTLLAFCIELLLFTYGIAFHLISVFLGKLFFDRWIARLRVSQGAEYLSNPEFYCLCLIPFLIWMPFVFYFVY